MIYFYNEVKKFCHQIDYVFQTIFCNLKINARSLSTLDYPFRPEDVVIIYSDNILEVKAKSISVLNSKQLFGCNYMKKESMNISLIIKKSYISIFHPVDKDIYIMKDKFEEKNIKTIVTNLDIFADIFFMLTRYEEYNQILKTKKDNYGRFLFSSSILSKKKGIVERPVVDEQIDLIRKWLQELNQDVPCTDKFHLAISHDVDALRKYNSFYNVKEDIICSLKNKNFRNVLEGIIYKRKDPYFNLSQIVKYEYKIGIKSSFYFICKKGNYDADYNINKSYIRKEIKKIENKNYEIGYHGSFDTALNSELIQKENHLIRHFVAKPYGSRQHYLKVAFPQTFQYLEKAKVVYDTSLTFPEHEGFRCGTSRPFKLYDLLENRVLNLWELPLIIMDATLTSYRKLSIYQVKKVLKQYAAVIEKYNYGEGGVLTILLHNNRLSDKNKDKYMQTYQKFCEDLITNKRATGLSGISTVNIYRKNFYEFYEK